MKDRFKRAIAHLKGELLINNNQDIIEAMNVNKSSFSSAVNGNDRYLTENFIRHFQSTYPIFNIGWLLTGEGDMLRNTSPPEEDLLTVPLLPIEAQGGSLNDFVVSVKDRECERVVSPMRDAEFAMSVAGESMAPEYPSGSQILIKRINEQAFIEWGKVYVLDTCNGTIIKKIMPSKKADCIRCLSINKAPEYAPFEVCIEDIYGIYKVLMCMSVK